MAVVIERLLGDHGRLRQVLDVLQAELDAAAKRREVDWPLAQACVDYCVNFCDLAHHACENLVFERMRGRDAAAVQHAMGSGDLIAAHEALTQQTRQLQRMILDIIENRESVTEGFNALGAAFLKEYREHIAWEERTIFPAAERILTAEDWAALESEIENPNDPVFGEQQQEAFRRLYDRITNEESTSFLRKLGTGAAQRVGDLGDTVARRNLRYGTLMREINVHERALSYNYLTPKVLRDSDGNEIPYKPGRLELRSLDVWRLLSPYFGVRIAEQLRAVVPLAIYLILFQLLILRQGIDGGVVVLFGLSAVIIGLMLFMEGLKLGLMPFAEVIGDSLPKKSSLAVVLIVVFLLGIGVTFAEPAIGALQAAGALVDVTKAPYLWALLNQWSQVVVLVVGAGVGLAAVLGTLRFLNGWSLKPYIYASLAPVLTLTVYMSFDENLSQTLGLAWDCGAVTTGPVTVPLVLALGIGIASAAGKGNSSLSGFGVVTLASLFPILAVMLLTLFVSWTTTPEAIIAAAQSMGADTGPAAWYEKTPAAETIGGIRAVVPLVIFLFLVLKVLLRAPLSEAGIVVYGLVLCVAGMCVFNVGLTYGLAELGAQSGSLIPAAFQEIGGVPESPLYIVQVGIPIAICFALILGFGATLAEPALNALGLTVENLTNGAFRKKVLMYAVSTGVGIGIALGVTKIIFGIPIAYLLIPAYSIGLILTVFSTEEFVNVAWDSAGVTTGPVTVPLVLAMGLGLGGAVGAVEGFGILSMASICPIISVLTVGLWIRHTAKSKGIAAESAN